MRFTRISTFAVILLLNWAAALPQSAGPAISLSWVTGSPGSQAVLSLKLEAPARARIGSVESRISFPTRQIAFASSKRGAAGAAAGAGIKTVLEPDPRDPAKTVVTVSIVPPPGVEAPSKSLASGLLADLSFQISEDADFGWISLGLESKAWTSDALPKLLEGVVSRGGKIHVTARGNFSCFFYMH